MQEERQRQERLKEEEARKKEAERKKKEEQEARSEQLRRQEEQRHQVSPILCRICLLFLWHFSAHSHIMAHWFASQAVRVPSLWFVWTIELAFIVNASQFHQTCKKSDNVIFIDVTLT